MCVPFCVLRTANMEHMHLKMVLIFMCKFLSQTCNICSPVNTHGVLIQMFLHIYGFECSEEKAHCPRWGHSGNLKQEGLALAFPGTRTLTLCKVLNFSAPDSLSKLAPYTRCPFTQMFSPSPRGRP